MKGEDELQSISCSCNIQLTELEISHLILTLKIHSVLGNTLWEKGRILIFSA